MYRFLDECSCASREYVFSSNNTHISYISVNGGETKTIISANKAFLGFDVHRLWYYNAATITLHNCRLDGSDIRTVLSNSNIGPFVVDSKGKRVYYINQGDNRLSVMAFNGTELPQVNVLKATDYKDIAFDSSNQ